MVLRRSKKDVYVFWDTSTRQSFVAAKRRLEVNKVFRVAVGKKIESLLITSEGIKQDGLYLHPYVFKTPLQIQELSASKIHEAYGAYFRRRRFGVASKFCVVSPTPLPENSTVMVTRLDGLRKPHKISELRLQDNDGYWYVVDAIRNNFGQMEKQ